MSVNPYTLNNLYSQGILDYAPYELCNSGINVSSMNGISNPYLNTAMQGTQFQNYGQTPDSFCASGKTGTVQPNPEMGSAQVSSSFGNENIGINSEAGSNAYGISGIGTQSQAGVNAYGISGVGTNSQAGMNAYGLQGIGAQSQAGENAYGLQGIGMQGPSEQAAWGGFGDTSQSIKDGISRVSGFTQNIPSPIKGLAVAGMMIGALALALKTKKKPQAKPKTNFFSNLNPVNWFKKTKTTKI